MLAPLGQGPMNAPPLGLGPMGSTIVVPPPPQGPMSTARSLIGLLQKESTANDAAAGLDNIVYRGDEQLRLNVLTSLSARPLPSLKVAPNLDLLLRRLQPVALERLKQAEA